jgi:predicted acetyltransferase
VIEIIPPSADLFASWRTARAEFAGAVMHGSGDWHFPDGAEPGSLREFERWVAYLVAQENPATELAAGRVHATYRWLVEDGEYAGCYTLRHALTPFLLEEGGHLGYSVRPSARRRGHATRMAHAALVLAGELGLDRVLVTADDDNVASQATIVRIGGVFEDTRNGRRRYWVDVRPAPF